MPRIKQRSGGADPYQAAASAIQGFRGGYKEGQDRARQQRRDAELARRYQEAEIKAQRQEAEKQMQREILMGHAQRAGKKVEAAFNSKRSDGAKMKPEEIKYFQDKMGQFQRTAQNMVQSGFTESQVRSFADEYREGMEQEMFGLEYQKVDERLRLMSLDEAMGYDPEQIKQIRKAMSDPDEMASPNELNQMLDKMESMYAANATQVADIQRKGALGQEILNKPENMRSPNWTSAVEFFNKNKTKMDWAPLEDATQRVLAGKDPFEEPGPSKWESFLDKAGDVQDWFQAGAKTAMDPEGSLEAMKQRRTQSLGGKVPDNRDAGLQNYQQ